ncbi:DUF397 domain-containing protein, partial [Streptomyces sp. NPDC004050]
MAAGAPGADSTGSSPARIHRRAQAPNPPRHPPPATAGPAADAGAAAPGRAARDPGAVKWRKSSKSDDVANCLEVAVQNGEVLIRESD